MEVADAENLLAQAEMDDSIARLNVWRGLFAVAYAQGDLKSFPASFARRDAREVNSHVADTCSIAQADYGHRNRLRAGSFVHPGLDADAHRYFPGPQSPRHLCRAALWRHEPAANRRVCFVLLRISLPLYQRDPERGSEVYPGQRVAQAHFLSGHGHEQALAQTISYVNRAHAFMPPGTVSPFVIRYDAGTLPVGYLVFSSPSRTLGEIQDLALNRVRPVFATLPGVSSPPPFGGNQRTIVVSVDPNKLRAYGLSTENVVQAIVAGNSIEPAGDANIGNYQALVTTDSTVGQISDLLDIPLRWLGAVRVPARRRNSIGFFGHSCGLRSGQRQANRLHSGDQTAQRFHDYRGRRGPRKPGAISVAGSRRY